MTSQLWLYSETPRSNNCFSGEVNACILKSPDNTFRTCILAPVARFHTSLLGCFLWSSQGAKIVRFDPAAVNESVGPIHVAGQPSVKFSRRPRTFFDPCVWPVVRHLTVGHGQHEFAPVSHSVTDTHRSAQKTTRKATFLLVMQMLWVKQVIYSM